MIRTYKTWKPSEVKQLKKLVADKTTDAQIATELGRSVSSIAQKRWDKGLVKFHKRKQKKLTGGVQKDKPTTKPPRYADLKTAQAVLASLGYRVVVEKI